MKKNWDYSRMKEVSIEFEGKQFTGRYFLEKGTLTLTSSYGQKSTQLGGLLPESLAKLLLRELVSRETTK